MIFTYLISFVLNLLSAIFSVFGEVHLPQFVYSTLALAMGYYNSAMQTLPFLELPFHMFLWVILPFELLLLVAKLFLGQRLPAHLN